MAWIARIAWPILVLVVLACAGDRNEEARQGGDEIAAGDTVATPAPIEPRVSNVMIGKRIGTGNRITEPTFEFVPQDTVYLSVAAEGAGEAGTLTAAWRSQDGKIVQQSTEPVPAAGEHAAFRWSAPKGLRAGTYKVVLFLDDDSVDTKVFVVRK